MLHRHACVSNPAIFEWRRARVLPRRSKSREFQGLKARLPDPAGPLGHAIETGAPRERRGRRRPDRFRHGRALRDRAVRARARAEGARCREGRSRPFRRADRRAAPTCTGWCAARCSPPRSSAGRIAAVLDEGRHRRARGEFPPAGRAQPPAVRGARDDQGVPRAGRAPTRRGDRRGHGRRAARATRISARSRTRSNR